MNTPLDLPFVMNDNGLSIGAIPWLAVYFCEEMGTLIWKACLQLEWGRDDSIPLWLDRGYEGWAIVRSHIALAPSCETDLKHKENRNRGSYT